MHKILLSISLLLAASSASSAENWTIRPGLWELTTTSLLLALVPQIPADTMQKLTSLAKQHGFDLRELFDGRMGNGKRGKVAIKYRDPSNSGNTWTGRGRMPRWMVSATKGRKAKREDFLI